MPLRSAVGTTVSAIGSGRFHDGSACLKQLAELEADRTALIACGLVELPDLSSDKKSVSRSLGYPPGQPRSLDEEDVQECNLWSS